MSSATKIRFDGDVADSFGAYLAMMMMPLTYSIANGNYVWNYGLGYCKGIFKEGKGCQPCYVGYFHHVLSACADVNVQIPIENDFIDIGF